MPEEEQEEKLHPTLQDNCQLGLAFQGHPKLA